MLEQGFSNRGDYISMGHLGKPGDIFGCHGWWGGRCSWLLLRYRTVPPSKNYPPSNVTSTEADRSKGNMRNKEQMTVARRDAGNVV